MLVAAALPYVLASRQRVVREVRAWALGGTLLSDDGVLFQSNDANCGHTAVMMVLLHHGVTVPLSLLQEARTAAVGLAVADVAERAERAGLPGTILHVPRDCLIERAFEALPLPAIALVGTHFIVLETPPVDGAVTVIDPGIGRMRWPVERLAKEWRSAVVAFGGAERDRVCG
jgi:ABC-type bacteriocin/lantibiotic exporter with double-glycine peptidase domain